MFRRPISVIVVIAFICSLVTPVPGAHAQELLGLPEPGVMVSLSPAYQPPIIKGLTVHKDNPFLFDFIVDVGQDNLQGQALKEEGQKLIKYFLASLAIPEKDLWVNLSPYEKDRTIPQALGQTEMGRDLLAQDYMLKQITASLIYPEKSLGKTFWDKVYAAAQEKFGTTQIPVNTFNKVWIMADKAEVFEHNQTVFVVTCHLKVMLEEDYLATFKNLSRPGDMLQRACPHAGCQASKPSNVKATQGSNLTQNIIREIILPQLEHEVNTGKNFANLRQICNSLILASWYKKHLKTALLNQVYSNQEKVKGIERKSVIASTAKQSQQDLSPEQIYHRYLEAYKKGVFNYIKEEQSLPRKYFSGGIFDSAQMADPAVITDPSRLQAAYAFVTNSLVRITAAFRSQPTPKINALNLLPSDERVKEIIDFIYFSSLYRPLKRRENIITGKRIELAKKLGINPDSEEYMDIWDELLAFENSEYRNPSSPEVLLARREIFAKKFLSLQVVPVMPQTKIPNAVLPARLSAEESNVHRILRVMYGPKNNSVSLLEGEMSSPETNIFNMLHLVGSRSVKIEVQELIDEMLEFEKKVNELSERNRPFIAQRRREFALRFDSLLKEDAAMPAGGTDAIRSSKIKDLERLIARYDRWKSTASDEEEKRLEGAIGVLRIQLDRLMQGEDAAMKTDKSNPMIGLPIALTGATGFLGSALSDALQEGGAKTRALVLDNTEAGKLEQRVPDFDQVEGSLVDVGRVKQLVHGQRVVINAAADTRTVITMGQTNEAAKVLVSNVLGAGLVLLAAKDEDKAKPTRKIFISSFDYTLIPKEAQGWVKTKAKEISKFTIDYYNGTATQTPQDYFNDIVEDYLSQKFAGKPYPLSKYLMDEVLRNLTIDLKIKEVVVLRIMGPVGIEMAKSQAFGVLMKMIKAVLNKDELPEADKATPYKGYSASSILVDDVVDVLMELSTVKLRAQRNPQPLFLELAGERMYWTNFTTPDGVPHEGVLTVITQTAKGLGVPAQNLFRNIIFVNPKGAPNVEVTPNLAPLARVLGHPVYITPLKQVIEDMTSAVFEEKVNALVDDIDKVFSNNISPEQEVRFRYFLRWFLKGHILERDLHEKIMDILKGPLTDDEKKIQADAIVNEAIEKRSELPDFQAQRVIDQQLDISSLAQFRQEDVLQTIRRLQAIVPAVKENGDIILNFGPSVKGPNLEIIRSLAGYIKTQKEWGLTFKSTHFVWTQTGNKAQDISSYRNELSKLIDLIRSSKQDAAAHLQMAPSHRLVRFMARDFVDHFNGDLVLARETVNNLKNMTASRDGPYTKLLIPVPWYWANNDLMSKFARDLNKMAVGRDFFFYHDNYAVGPKVSPEGVVISTYGRFDNEVKARSFVEELSTALLAEIKAMAIAKIKNDLRYIVRALANEKEAAFNSAKIRGKEDPYLNDYDHGPPHAADLLEKAVALANKIKTSDGQPVFDQIDWDVLIAAIALHDIFAYDDIEHGPQAIAFARQFLRGRLTDAQIEAVVEAIDYHDKREPDDVKKRKEKSIETQLLYDIDQMEALEEYVKGVYRYSAVYTRRYEKENKTLEGNLKHIKGSVPGNADKRINSLSFIESKEMARAGYEKLKEFFQLMDPDDRINPRTWITAIIQDHESEHPVLISRKAMAEFPKSGLSAQGQAYAWEFFNTLESIYSRTSEYTEALDDLIKGLDDRKKNRLAEIKPGDIVTARPDSRLKDRNSLPVSGEFLARYPDGVRIKLNSNRIVTVPLTWTIKHDAAMYVSNNEISFRIDQSFIPSDVRGVLDEMLKNIADFHKAEKAKGVEEANGVWVKIYSKTGHFGNENDEIADQLSLEPDLSKILTIGLDLKVKKEKVNSLETVLLAKKRLTLLKDAAMTHGVLPLNQSNYRKIQRNQLTVEVLVPMLINATRHHIGTNVRFLTNAINRRQQLDKMAERSGDRASIVRPANGGIDLNTNKTIWTDRKEGSGVEMKVDPAMIERVRREGIDSLTPEIYSITPVVSIWPLIGLESP